jgi:hypothetical protein
MGESAIVPELTNLLLAQCMHYYSQLVCFSMASHPSQILTQALETKETRDSAIGPRIYSL